MPEDFAVTERLPLYRSPFANLDLKVVRGENGERLEFLYLDVVDFCNIVPVTAAGDVVFVSQYRVGIEACTVEIPGGLTDSADPGPRESALRELREETGYAPAPGALTLELGWTYPNPAIQGNRCHFFACGPVERVEAIRNDPNECTEIVLIPIEEVRARLGQGGMRHALILNAFQMLELRGGKSGREPFEHVLHRLARGGK
jgi:8-oxo-dGTP pyrophosphatase MutT (NUDIX family)